MAIQPIPKPALSSSLLILLLIFYFLSGLNLTMAAQKTWCVAKPSSDNLALTNNLQYACSQVDCSRVLKKGCPCFYPDYLISHASIAMNLYYQAKGRNYWNCDFNKAALITISDPSYDSCIYP